MHKRNVFIIEDVLPQMLATPIDVLIYCILQQIREPTQWVNWTLNNQLLVAYLFYGESQEVLLKNTIQDDGCCNIVAFPSKCIFSSLTHTIRPITNPDPDQKKYKRHKQQLNYGHHFEILVIPVNFLFIHNLHILIYYTCSIKGSSDILTASCRFFFSVS